MKHSTNDATSWVALLLDKQISGDIFLKCFIPQHPPEAYALSVVLKSLITQGKEIDAVNVWEMSKSNTILKTYVEIQNFVDCRPSDQPLSTQEEEIPDPIQALKIKEMINVLEAVSGKKYEDLLIEASKHSFEKLW